MKESAMETDVIGLIARVRAGGQGSRQAQEALYEAARLHLLQRLAAVIPRRARGRMDAEDLLHVSFVRAMNNLHRFEAISGDGFFGWVYRIARNMAIDVSRRRSAGNARYTMSTDALDVPVARLPAPPGRDDKRLAYREWLESVLHRLGARDAELLRLRVLEERSFQAIAEQQARTPGAVQRAYSRALQRARDMVADESGSWPLN